MDSRDGQRMKMKGLANKRTDAWMDEFGLMEQSINEKLDRLYIYNAHKGAKARTQFAETFRGPHRPQKLR